MAKKERLNEKGVPFGARQRMPIWYGAVWSTRGIAAPSTWYWSSTSPFTAQTFSA